MGIFANVSNITDITIIKLRKWHFTQIDLKGAIKRDEVKSLRTSVAMVEKMSCTNKLRKVNIIWWYLSEIG